MGGEWGEGDERKGANQHCIHVLRSLMWSASCPCVYYWVDETVRVGSVCAGWGRGGDGGGGRGTNPTPQEFSIGLALVCATVNLRMIIINIISW